MRVFVVPPANVGPHARVTVTVQSRPGVARLVQYSPYGELYVPDSRFDPNTVDLTFLNVHNLIFC